MNTLYRILILSISLFASLACAGPAQTESWQVLSYIEGQNLAKAELKSLNWKTGSWHWEAPMNGQMEGEVNFTEAVHGQMLGLARGYGTDGIAFNEIATLTQVGETLELRLRHFGSDLQAWEPQNQPQVLKLLKVEGQVYYFEDHTYVKRDDNHYTLFVRVRSKDGSNEIFKVEHQRIAVK